ncbi:MAG: PAS domain-containing sensor histidine kinase [Rhodospirillaceae bacterium]|nr:MAG: PAS domain-containing sensor histidine kinase [Rhodospirillaceae bacterium]
MLGQAGILLTAPWIMGIVAVVVIVPPAAWLLWRQHGHWRRAEDARNHALYVRKSLECALETAPEGYFAWFSVPASTKPDSIADGADDGLPAPWRRNGEKRTVEVCSRRLAVLLDLFRGMAADFEQVVDGFDRPSQEKLRTAIVALRSDGTGFQIALDHSITGRHLQARGLRAVDDDGNFMADVMWMGDVTEGVAAVDTLTEETGALRRERDLLRAAMDGLTEPVWLRDDDLSLIYCNAAYVRAVDGRDAGDVVARGRELAPRVSVREARALAAAARASAETRRAPFHMVIDGSRRLMEVTEAAVSVPEVTATAIDREAAPLFSDGSGRLTAGLAYDITRQEELEVRLKREAAAHADVLERLGTAIAVFGPDTRLAFFNTAFSRLWSLDPVWLRDSPSYTTVLDALRADRRLPEVADFPAYKEKELMRFNSLIEPLEDVLHLPDGGTLRRVVAPHPMGGLLTTYEDVTDKLALERSYNTLIAVQRETIDNLQEAVAVFGADGRLRLANPAFASLWDLSIAALRESPSMAEVIEAFRHFFEDPNIWARHRGVMLTALDADRERATQQGRVIRSDGSVLEFVSVPLPDGGVLFCYNDVSAPERIAQTLRGKAEALSIMEKLRTAFISHAADELQGPLGAIARSAGKVAARAEPGLRGTAAEILAAAEDIKALLADINDIAALEAGQQTLRLDTVDMAAIVTRVTAMTREAVRHRNVVLNVACPANIGWIVGDPQRLKQTLFYLVTTAVTAAGEGDVFLSLDRSGGDGGQIDITLRYVAAAALDHGAGALELHFARRMAELHGGNVEVETSGPDALVVCRLPAGPMRAASVG